MSTIVLRSVKGSPLSNTEVDTNFTNLNTDKTELGGTYSAGTANGVLFLSSSKVLTTGSALTFDGTNFKTTGYAKAGGFTVAAGTLTAFDAASGGLYGYYSSGGVLASYSDNSGTLSPLNFDGSYLAWRPAGTEGMRLTSTGLGIGTSSPSQKLDVAGNVQIQSTGTFYLNNSDNTNQYYWQNIGASGANNATLILSRTNVGETLRIDSSGNLGIGTSSPAYKLDVNGAARVNNLLWFTPSSGLMAIGASGTNFHIYNGAGAETRVTLDSSGNLGLGVTPSAWASGYRSLDVLSFGASLASSGAGATSTNLSHGAYFDGTNWIQKATDVTGARYQMLGSSSGSSHSWFIAPNSTAGNAISFTQAMTLDASGNLGVGTTSPSARLHLAAAGDTVLKIAPSSAGTARIRLEGTGGGAAAINSQSNGLFIATEDAAPMVFSTNNTERARIDSSGSLLVGKTSSSSVVVGAQIDGSGFISSTRSGSTNATSTFEVYSTGASAFRFYVDMSGTINATSIVITAISDQRLKENVRDIETGLDAIMSLKPRRFDWKEGKGQDKKNVAGFIAQEFEEVFPECVGVTKAGADGIEYKNINHETLIPTLVKAIQEQQAIINSLKARLDAANI
jgi:hypothetical protein